MKKEEIEALKHLTLVVAAKKLKISKSTLIRKCREFNISFTLKEKNSAEKINRITGMLSYPNLTIYLFHRPIWTTRRCPE